MIRKLHVEMGHGFEDADLLSIKMNTTVQNIGVSGLNSLIVLHKSS